MVTTPLSDITTHPSGACCEPAFPFPCPSASDNIPRADEIRTLVKDTWDTRMAKLRLSADSFVRQQEAHAKVCQHLIPGGIQLPRAAEG